MKNSNENTDDSYIDNDVKKIMKRYRTTRAKTSLESSNLAVEQIFKGRRKLGDLKDIEIESMMNDENSLERISEFLKLKDRESNTPENISHFVLLAAASDKEDKGKIGPLETEDEKYTIEAVKNSSPPNTGTAILYISKNEFEYLSDELEGKELCVLHNNGEEIASGKFYDGMFEYDITDWDKFYQRASTNISVKIK